MIDSASEIYAALKNDADFMSHVGHYDFGTGTIETALTVLASNQQIPGVKKIVGVEAIIGRVPDTTSRAMVAGCSIREKVWRIYLVQYEGSDLNDAMAAADRILDLCPGATYSSVGAGSTQSDIAGIDQIVVKIPAHAPWANTFAGRVTPNGTLSIDGGASCH